MTVTWEQANAAAAARPDLPASAVEAARTVGPAALLALARNHPTPQQLTAEELEQRRRLEMATRRKLAQRALEAITAMDGLVDGKHVDDAFKRDVCIAIGGGELLAEVKRLAAWEVVKARGEAVSREEWQLVKAACDSEAVKTALFRAATIIQQARADRHAKKRKRAAGKASGA